MARGGGGGGSDQSINLIDQMAFHQRQIVVVLWKSVWVTRLCCGPYGVEGGENWNGKTGSVLLAIGYTSMGWKVGNRRSHCLGLV